MTALRWLLYSILLLASGVGLAAADSPSADRNSLALRDELLRPAFWIDRLSEADAVILDSAGIAALNRQTLAQDGSLTRLAELPDSIEATQVRERILRVSAPLVGNRIDASGETLREGQRQRLSASLALQRLPETVVPRFALVRHRADLRSYPTRMAVFSDPDQRDIDRFQESALFPGEPVASLHASADQRWRFVVSERYSAWIEADALAEGSRAEVLGYAAREPALTVVGSQVRSVRSRQAGALSGLLLDMGVRLPWRHDWPADRPVNGQLPLAHWVVELPDRDADGRLMLRPALISKTEALAPGPLPYTRAAVITQAFRFLGERYGWGHADEGRDCSGFVSEIYRSVGILLPRNTGDQASTPALDADTIARGADTATRQQQLDRLQAGDLIFIPGHVMMMIGRLDDQIWVIHDVYQVRLLIAGDLLTLPINGVALTPLEPLRAEDGSRLVDQITRLVRVRPAAAILPSP